MPVKQPCIIQWFRRDLRITDHTSLSAAVASGLPVLPVYILSEWHAEHAWTGPKRQHFLCGCLASLAANLETIGGRLIIRKGDAVDQLSRLIAESGAIALHFTADPDPYGKAIEKRLIARCGELGVACHAHADVALHDPTQVLTQSGLPYRVYTPYSRNWLSLPKPAVLPKPGSLQTPPTISSLPLPTVAHWGLPIPSAALVEAGEKAARERLKRAINNRIRTYALKRDFPAESGTSRLSQDLRFGLLSVRTIFAAAMKARESSDASSRAGIDVFIKELAWREFYFAILHHFPNVLNEEFNADWRGLPWVAPNENFEAWKNGQTGFPIVDAGMRELLNTGFMHNRVRMITAMFLTKDLHIDWKLGESWFMQHLVDGEIAANNGGWQWSAGTGADAAPYFRIQNPWSQTARYDPKGNYIRKWVPELAKTAAAMFMEPPKNGLPIAKDYPLPCVDHKTEREKTLVIFKRHREGTRPI